jgi:uncharacterized protein (TIGR02145 family)
MKKIIFLLSLLMPVFLLVFSCEKEEIQQPQEAEALISSGEQFPVIPEALRMIGDESYTLTDIRDGQKYRAVSINHVIWMAENLNFKIDGSWYYADDPVYAERFGRLYTWQAANKACPPGWRLPTLSEAEDLFKYFGFSKPAFDALMIGGSSGFDAVLGGSRRPNGEFHSIHDAGIYWLGFVPSLQKGAYFFDGPDFDVDFLYGLNEENGYSCRCVMQ